jgi:hypothetical protein
MADYITSNSKRKITGNLQLVLKQQRPILHPPPTKISIQFSHHKNGKFAMTQKIKYKTKKKLYSQDEL